MGSKYEYVTTLDLFQGERTVMVEKKGTQKTSPNLLNNRAMISQRGGAGPDNEICGNCMHIQAGNKPGDGKTCFYDTEKGPYKNIIQWKSRACRSFMPEKGKKYGY